MSQPSCVCHKSVEFSHITAVPSSAPVASLMLWSSTKARGGVQSLAWPAGLGHSPVTWLVHGISTSAGPPGWVFRNITNTRAAPSLVLLWLRDGRRVWGDHKEKWSELCHIEQRAKITLNTKCKQRLSHQGKESTLLYATHITSSSNNTQRVFNSTFQCKKMEFLTGQQLNQSYICMCKFCFKFRSSQPQNPMHCWWGTLNWTVISSTCTKHSSAHAPWISRAHLWYGPRKCIHTSAH